MIRFVLTFLYLICLSCNDIEAPKDEINSGIYKPKGLYSSSFGKEVALDNGHVKGALIRVRWKDIEPEEGVFNFLLIDQFLESIKERNLEWSLGIIAGESSPDWLFEDPDVGSFEITDYYNNIKRIPKMWDAKVNVKLNQLALALAAKYGSDEDLTLIYVPQMTANGIEGHFNGVPEALLINAGFTAEKWVNSIKEAAENFAIAFPDKAIAVEVHDLINDSAIPNQIITDLWNDSSLNQRVGAAIWWISGKTTYQPNLLDALTAFPGDIYAQAIGRSDQTERFKDDDYSTMFSQAKLMGVRYIELWEYEFVNNTFPQEFADFNTYANDTFE
jgi:hypothetical protein